MNRYLLDANVFIQAKNLYYGLDFCPAFWDWLIVQGSEGKVASLDAVADELHAGKDDLSAWAKGSGKILFHKHDQRIEAALEKVSQWAKSQNYDSSAVAIFLQIADYWLVSHALAHDYILVSHEIPSKTARKIKIPNACLGLGIKYVSSYDMLRKEGARFVIDTDQSLKGCSIRD